MNAKPAIISFIIAVLGVAAMMYVANQDSKRDRTAPKETGRLLSSAQLPVDAVTRISLQRKDQPRMVFERSGGNWNQVEPFFHPMDSYSMRQLATNARELVVHDSIEVSDSKGQPSLASMELQPAAAEVMYQWPEGALTLQLGRRSVAGRAYVRVAGDGAKSDQVFVVNAKLHERAIEAEPNEWRDRAIFHNVGVESLRIETEQAGAEGAVVRLTLSRDRKQWKMLEPVQTRVDPNGRDVYLQDLGRAVVSGFVLDQPMPADLSKFGLDAPVATLSVTSPLRSEQTAGASTTMPSAGTEVQRLVIGSRTGANSQDRFGMVDGRPVVVKIPEAALKVLFRLPKDLADPVASGVVAADVKAIVLRGDGHELRLERDLETWRAPERNNAVVNGAFVQELLDQLTSLRAPNVEFKPYPRELEIGSITLYGYDAKPMDTVRVAKDKDSGQIALENGDNVLRVFPPAMKIRMTAEDFGLRQ